ncbi:hypothetical protein BC829DRAFT_434966 [Chytridium lagenaria]|nr:hypothetical protein BC829DRAFT_434966 [Chytridium lagenaria]
MYIVGQIEAVMVKGRSGTESLEVMDDGSYWLENWMGDEWMDEKMFNLKTIIALAVFAASMANGAAVPPQSTPCSTSTVAPVATSTPCSTSTAAPVVVETKTYAVEEPKATTSVAPVVTETKGYPVEEPKGTTTTPAPPPPPPPWPPLLPPLSPRPSLTLLRSPRPPPPLAPPPPPPVPPPLPPLVSPPPLTASPSPRPAPLPLLAPSSLRVPRPTASLTPSPPPLAAPVVVPPTYGSEKPYPVIKPDEPVVKPIATSTVAVRPVVTGTPTSPLPYNPEEDDCEEWEDEEDCDEDDKKPVVVEEDCDDEDDKKPVVDEDCEEDDVAPVTTKPFAYVPTYLAEKPNVVTTTKANLKVESGASRVGSGIAAVAGAVVAFFALY